MKMIEKPQTPERPKKEVKIILFGGLQKVLRGNTEISRKDCNEVLREAYGKEGPSSLSAYYAFGKALSDGLIKDPIKYNHRNYD
jgi:hypothetical protein